MLQQLQNMFQVMTMKKGAELEKIENQYKEQMERLAQQHVTKSDSSEEMIALKQKLQEMEIGIQKKDDEWKVKMEEQKCTMEANFQSDLKLFIAEAVATHKTEWESDKEALESKNDAELENIKAEMTHRETTILELQKKLGEQQRGFEEEIEKKSKEELRMNMELNQSMHELQELKDKQRVQYEKDMKVKFQQYEQIQRQKMEVLQKKHVDDIQSQLEKQKETLSNEYKSQLDGLKSNSDGMESLNVQLKEALDEIASLKEKEAAALKDK